MTDDLDTFLSKRADDNSAREQKAQRELIARDKDERTLSESSGPEFAKLLELIATKVDGRTAGKSRFQWDANNMVLRLGDASLNFMLMGPSKLTRALARFYYSSGHGCQWQIFPIASGDAIAWGVEGGQHHEPSYTSDELSLLLTKGLVTFMDEHDSKRVS